MFEAVTYIILGIALIAIIWAFVKVLVYALTTLTNDDN